MTGMALVSSHMLPHRTPAQMLAIARRGLAEAERTESPGMRYANAHLAAVLACAAVLATRPRHDSGRRREQAPGVWVLLATVAPELADWAAHFASTGSNRAACEAGIPHVVDDAEADRMVAAAETFVALVGRDLP